MITRVYARLRLIRRWFNRSEWSVKSLGLNRYEARPDEPGLLLIQIDGLGHKEFQKALHNNRLPFIKRLLNREDYILKSLYAGVPSTTPAVQAELFYGVKTAVPAFSYLDPDDSSLVKLFDPVSAKKIEDILKNQAEGLMTGGAAYGNIFSGGAEDKEAHFCVSALRWDELKKSIHPFSILFLVLVNILSVFRVLGLLILELILAVVDFVKGVRAGENLRSEAKFILARVGVCIGLRELIAIGASMDIARGVPVIQLNLAGFDEQSHRRGPSSAFAHWVLKGIDRTIKRLWHEAKRSPHRDYHVWIYSDHGQENVQPYMELAGRRIQEVVTDLVSEIVPEAAESTSAENPAPSSKMSGQQWDVFSEAGVFYRAKTMNSKSWRKTYARADSNEPERPDKTRIIAMGPIGFVYTPVPISFSQKSELATRLTRDHHVPCALAFDDEKNFFAWHKGERLCLPEQKDKVFGKSHPFADYVYDDLLALCEHPGAGDLIISGWCNGESPISFPIEKGSHGGFGPNETHGIALVDSLSELTHRTYDHVRASDLRLGALRLLARHEESQTYDRSIEQPQPVKGALKARVMTYNIHSCLGMDRRCSPSRIARLIDKFDPQIVALQEVDRDRKNTGGTYQADLIAKTLNMHFLYYPVVKGITEQYGMALLSRWPLQEIKTGQLPALPAKEPRGVLWACVEMPEVQLQILVVHLALSTAERRLQIDCLMGDDWLGAARTRGPVILLGDFNASDKSYTLKQIASTLKDVQMADKTSRLLKTFISTNPHRRIDHIFVSDDIRIGDVHRPVGIDYQMASDHLPLVADLEIEALTKPDVEFADMDINVEPGIKRSTTA